MVQKFMRVIRASTLTVAPSAGGCAVPRRAGVVGPAGELAVELDGRARAEEAGESREGYKATQDHLGSHGKERRGQGKPSAVLCAVVLCATQVCPRRLFIACRSLR